MGSFAHDYHVGDHDKHRHMQLLTFMGPFAHDYHVGDLQKLPSYIYNI